MPLPLFYDQPNCGQHTGPDRIYRVQVDGGNYIHRRGGKFCERNTMVAGQRYKLADDNSTHLAGFFCTEQIPHPIRGTGLFTDSGDILPVNFGLEATAVIPCSGRSAEEGDIGRDYDITLRPGATPQQYILLTGTARRILRVSQIVDRSGSHVAAGIPPALRIGNL